MKWASLSEIERALAEGGTMTLAELTARLYPDISPGYIGTAKADTSAKLYLLRKSGRAASTPIGSHRNEWRATA